MQKMRPLLTTIALIAALCACKPGESSQEPADDTGQQPATSLEILVTDLSTLKESEWILIDLCGTPMPDDANISLAVLEDGRISGNAAVNRYSGPLILDEGVFHFGPFMTTRMAGPPEAMDRESAFLQALSAATSIRMSDDGQLIIAVENQEHPLRFKPVDQ